MEPVRSQTEREGNLKFQGYEPEVPGPSRRLLLEQPAGRAQLLAPQLLAADPPVVSPEAAAVLELLRARHGRRHIRGHATRWRVWQAWCRLHDLAADAPRDVDVVAFVHARALVGLSWASINASLWTLQVGLDDPAVVVPAVRHLTDLHGDGWFDVAAQAPVLTLGEVVAMARRAPTARDRMLVVVTYLAGLRPAEWVAVGREHIEVTADGRVLMLLPTTKTGAWQKVEVAPLPGTPLDPAAAVTAYLAERGDDPGPLLTRRRGGRAGLGAAGVSGALVAAARAGGAARFSPYSLRRSMAVHANLLGVPGAQIGRRLRHSRNAQTWRRYIEPLLALLDPEELVRRWLSPVQPAGPVGRVRSGLPEQAPRFAFAAGTIAELTADVDLTALRVPAELATLSRATIEHGERTRRRFLGWCREQGHVGGSPPPLAVSQWLRSLEVQPVTLMSLLAALRIGWLSTARGEPPGYGLAHQWVPGYVRQTLREAGAGERRYKSRSAEPGEVAVVCAAAWDAVLPAPGTRWAVRALALAVGAAETVEVLTVDGETATVLADGRRRVARMAPAGVFCPVLAAGWLVGRGTWAVPRRLDAAAVLSAAAPYTGALLRALVTTLLAGSGCRPSDLARARTSGIEEHPAAWVVRQTTSKGRRPGRLGRGRVVLAPGRDGAADPFTAWEAWTAWWPVDGDGYVVPDSLLSADTVPARRGQRTERVAAAIGRMVREAIALAELEPGLTAYGFRYGITQAYWDAGASLEVISELLGHDSTGTTAGYLQDLDPFSDGAADRFAARLAGEVAS